MKQRELFRAERLPVLQNRVFDSAAEALACATGDMVLVQDGGTGLVFNAAFDPERLVYDAQYQNEQAHSQVFQRHLDEVEAVMARHLRSDTLIEVGCGKGYFLEHLIRAGYRVTGIDPAYEGDNPHVVKAAFEPGLGLSAGGVVLRHVLEHLCDPVQFLAGIARANGGQGRIYIEVPCFDWICRQRAWFDVFYEHVNYFRSADFRRMFGEVLETGHLFGGQYLYVVAELASLREPRASGADRVDFPQDFLAGIERHARRMVAAKGIPKAVWGGASKGVIFTLYMQRAGICIDQVIDINPAKQGRYLPVSGIRISSPAQAERELPPGAPVYVMNSNYLAEIVAQSGNRYTYHTVDENEL